MLVIGLTGGIASGKNTVAAMLRKANIPVIDADLLAREVTAKGSMGLCEVMTAFGRAVVNDDGTLNRQKLASIVFNNQKELKKLEGILHPKIAEASRHLLEHYEKEAVDIVVYMAPLLFEKRFAQKLDKTILVVADKVIRKKRIMARDNLTPDEIEKRFSAQLCDFVTRPLADEIIENNGSLDELYKNLSVAWYRLTNKNLPKKFGS